MVNAVILTLLTAALGVLGTSFWNARAEKKALLARVTELERLNALVTQAVVPISAAFQAILVKKLTHFHTPVMDKLLEKLGPPITLTDDEEKELIEALKQREIDVNGLIDDAERDCARMLPIVMRMVKAETEIPDADKKIQVVTVAPEEDKPKSEQDNKV